jgi:hypothetical protein
MYMMMTMEALVRQLDYIAHCERQCIRDDIVQMTANMSEIRTYNIGMREQAE